MKIIDGQLWRHRVLLVCRLVSRKKVQTLFRSCPDRHFSTDCSSFIIANHLETMPPLCFGSQLNLEPGSWLDVVREIVEGTVSGTIRAFYVLAAWAYVNIIRPLANVIGVQLPEGKREKIPGAKLKVAAIGYSRTGTVSYVRLEYLELRLIDLFLP